MDSSKPIDGRVSGYTTKRLISYSRYLRSVSNILAGEFVSGNSDRGEISHHHLTIVDLSVGVAWSSQGTVG